MMGITTLLMGNLTNYCFHHYRHRQLNVAHYNLKLLIEAVVIRLGSQPPEGGGRGETAA